VSRIELSEKISKELREENYLLKTRLKKDRLAVKHFMQRMSGINNPRAIIYYVKQVLKAVDEGNLDVLRRKAKNLKVVGICDHCQISLIGRHQAPTPENHTMPCNIEGCPFEKDEHINTVSKHQLKIWEKEQV